MYFYYVDVAKLTDNQRKLKLREEFVKLGWEPFSINFDSHWFIREFAVGWDYSDKPPFPPLPSDVRISEESFYQR